jgi:hypothetical protein
MAEWLLIAELGKTSRTAANEASDRMLQAWRVEALGEFAIKLPDDFC